MCQLHGGCAILNLMCCVKTFSSVLKKSLSPLTVRSFMMFKKVTAFCCGQNEKHLDKFSEHIAAFHVCLSVHRCISAEKKTN